MSSSTTPSSRSAVFSQRIVILDHYLTAPNPLLDKCIDDHQQQRLHLVPVLRIFGATDQGQKCCLHVHQIFPYILVPVPEDLTFLIVQNASTQTLVLKEWSDALAVSLNHALAISYSKKVQDPTSRFVVSIRIVKGIPFYGFHAAYEYFAKIHLIDPSTVSRTCQLLESGAVMGRSWQTYESHIPYQLQFLIDYNLFGMDFIRFVDLKFRSPVQTVARKNAWNANSGRFFYTEETVQQRQKWTESDNVPRSSTCEIEADTWPWCILNRHEVSERITESLINLDQPKPLLGKLVHSLKSIWEDERTRREALKMEPVGTPRICPEMDRNRAKFRNEDEMMARVRQRIQTLLPSISSPIQEFATLPNNNVPTVFSSVSCLYPELESETEPFPSPLLPVPSEELPFSQIAAQIDENIIKEWRSQKSQKAASQDLQSFLQPNRLASRLPHSQPMQMDAPNDDDGDDDDDDEALEILQHMAAGEYEVSEYASPTRENNVADDDTDIAIPDDRTGTQDSISDVEDEGLEELEEYLMSQVHEAVVDMEMDGLENMHDLSDYAAEIFDYHTTPSSTGAERPTRPSEFTSSGELAEIEELVTGPRLPQVDGLNDTQPPKKRQKAPASARARKPISNIPKADLVDEIVDSDEDDQIWGINSSNLQSQASLVGESDSTSTAKPKFLARSQPKVRPIPRDYASPSRKIHTTNVNSNMSHPAPVQTKPPRRKAPSNAEVKSIPTTPYLKRSFGISKFPTPQRNDSIFIGHLAKMWSSSEEDEDKKKQSFFNSPPKPCSPSASFQQHLEENHPELSPHPHVSESSADPPGQVVHSENDPIISRSPRVRFDVPISSSIETSNRTRTTPPTPKTPVPPQPKVNVQDVYTFPPPPSKATLLDTLQDYNIPEVVYRDPFYSDSADVPRRTRTVAGREFRLKGDGVEFLPEFDTTNVRAEGYLRNLERPTEEREKRFWKGKAKGVLSNSDFHASPQIGRQTPSSSKNMWTLNSRPPRLDQVLSWIKEQKAIASNAEQLDIKAKAKKISQIEGPTQAPFGFKYAQIQSDKLKFQKEWVTILSVEVFVQTRGHLKPDPKMDRIEVVFYCIQSDDESEFVTNGRRPGYHVGIIAIDDGYRLPRSGLKGFQINLVQTELELLQTLAAKVQEWDPDIMSGYEIHNSSWGYLIDRATLAHEMELVRELSRLDEESKSKYGKEQDSYGHTHTSSVHVTGRIVLNIWRLLRSELALTSYTLESCVYHVLHYRTPSFSHQNLTKWYSENDGILRWKTLSYYLNRVQINLELLDNTEMISRTSEFARVYGIDFYSVISRGSQFKVESMMCRLAKPENFIMVSATKQQVAGMRAAEALPLVMEPLSRFYNSPLLVLDFQSLYPSIMIGYNYCFSTCLGRVSHLGEKHQLGTNMIDVSPDVLELLKDHVNVTPNGIVFVKSHVRRGVLGRLLMELLETRVMVKGSVKNYRDDKSILRILEARQLSLKLIANVTYGYTAASFSGRMPCAEIADSIVQTGREILEQSIKLINANAKWGASVVYGDTDSLFVYLPGCSRHRAFAVGRDIVSTITSLNPHPITLKFEKVYHPCVLLSKKRYVGFKFESITDKEPIFDAKGIETVRRDGCPVVAKMMEHSLKTLFRSQDLSQVKEYCCRQWTKILSGRISIQDFIIAKEVKLGLYSDHGPPPPGALISMQKMSVDSRAEPQHGERVPYVVVHGAPGARLIDCVISPEDLMNNRHLRLNGVYYILKQIIPPLSRVFNLVGADVLEWFKAMPKIDKVTHFTGSRQDFTKYATIDQFYTAQNCAVCSKVCKNELCVTCGELSYRTMFVLSHQLREAEGKFKTLTDLCRHCASQSSPATGEVPCVSLDCPVFYVRIKARNDLKLISERVSRLQ